MLARRLLAASETVGVKWSSIAQHCDALRDDCVLAFPGMKEVACDGGRFMLPDLCNY